jgi:hypothetical protein
MAQTKLVISPRALLSKVPAAVRLTYFALLGLSLSWTVAQVTDAVLTKNWWMIAVAVFVGYLVADTGLVVLRGRKVGRTLTRFWAVGILALAVSDVLSGSLTSALAVAAAVFGLVAVVAVSLKASAAHFAANAGKSLSLSSARAAKTGSTPAPASAGGSWEDMLAEERSKK